jgi:3-hydroxyisobutyrate dehydrogenase
MAQVAFLGTGLLGSGMSERMLRQGQDVVVWNRSVDKTRPLEALGAKVAATPEAAVAGASFVHMVLADDAVVDAVIDRMASHLGPETIVVDHSTTSPAATKARFERGGARAFKLLHAPVFMTPQMCRDGSGLMLASGPQRVFDAVKDRLAAMAGDVWYQGERPELAAALKIFGNSMIFVLTAGIADVSGMAANLGVPLQDAVGLFSKFHIGGLVNVRAVKMASGDPTATFELTMARKDMRLMLEAAGTERLIVLPAIAKRMDEAIAAGHGQHDMGVSFVQSK